MTKPANDHAANDHEEGATERSESEAPHRGDGGGDGSKHDADLRDAEVRRYERRLAHSPEKVWRAITEESELAAWFPANVEGERSEGAELRFTEPGSDAPSRGEILTWEPPRVLEYTWGAETLRWELSPIPGGCLLVLTTASAAREEPARIDAPRASAFRLAA